MSRTTGSVLSATSTVADSLDHAYTPVHRLFEAQVARTPHALAVIGADEQVSYAELNRQAECVAHQLRRLGVGPESLVGLCVERSVAMIAGLLGILKAGGAYVPLDPDYPSARLALMLADGPTTVLVTQERLRARLPFHAAQIVYLEQVVKPHIQPQPHDLPFAAAGEHAAYVIYTSGSTGAPKGVVVPHSALAHYSLTARAAYTLDPHDRVLQFASISFDASVEEIFPCLLAGATLALRTDAMLESLTHFLDHCAAWQITVLNLPTAYWHELCHGLELARGAIPASVRLVIIGGEQARPEQVAAWRRHVDLDIRLVNTYGPTEATVVTTMADIAGPRAATTAENSVPIGRPIPGAEVYVLDAAGRPVPDGAAGELYIGGVGLARGYLQRPDLTAARFVAHPFSRVPGARLYRTGDMARFRADGALEFLGRCDQQVKIRGYRVELGEIETALRQHPSVREALVVAQAGAAGDTRLVAYVVAHSKEPAASDRALRLFLTERLPSYMLPAALVRLDALPLISTGKVDRQGLSRAQPEPTDCRDAPLAARDPLELQLAQIWEEVLDQQPVGVRDNFFDCGGHSLLALRLVTLIEQRFGQGISPAAIFAEPTVEGQARLLRETAGDTPPPALVALQPKGRKPPFFYVPSAGSTALTVAALARAMDLDRPFYAFEPRGLGGAGEPHVAVEAMARDYLREIRALRPDGPYLLGGGCFGGLVALEMAQQLRAEGQEVPLLVVQNGAPPRPAPVTAAHYLGRVAYHWRNGDVGAVLARHVRRAGRRIAMRLEERRGGSPSAVADRLQRVLDAHFTANRNYIARPYAGRITLLWCSDVYPLLGQAWEAGWAGLAVGGITSHVIPVKHRDLLQSPGVAPLAARLCHCCDAALR